MSNNNPDDESRTDSTRHDDQEHRSVPSSAVSVSETPDAPTPYDEVKHGTVTGIEANVRIIAAEGDTSLAVTAIRDDADFTIDLRWTTEAVSIGLALDMDSTRSLISTLQSAVDDVDSEE